MLRFLLTRVSLLVPTFIGMTLLAFFLIRMVPGDPIETMAGERGIDPARHAQLRTAYGFDKPVIVQYGMRISEVAHNLQETVKFEVERAVNVPVVEVNVNVQGVKEERR